MKRHTLVAASLVLPLVLSAGCLHRQAATQTPSTAERGPGMDPEHEPMPPQSLPQVVTDEAQLAMDAAADAEMRGDIEMALELYDWASMAQVDSDQRAEVSYRMARLRSDPESQWFDPEKSRTALASIVAESPAHPRAPEARVILALLDRIESGRAATAGLESDLEQARARLAAMKEELEKKDQELKSIKDVLLRKQP